MSTPLQTYVATAFGAPIPAAAPATGTPLPGNVHVTLLSDTSFVATDFFEISLPSGLAIPFAGVRYSKFWVSASGYIQLYPDPAVDVPADPTDSAGLIAADNRVIMAPWWQPLKSGTGGAAGQIQVIAAVGVKQFVHIIWLGIHTDDDNTYYRRRTFELFVTEEPIGTFLKPGTVYFGYQNPSGLTQGGAPTDPADASVGVKDGTTWRAPHNEADGSDATYQFGGHASIQPGVLARNVLDEWGGEWGWYEFAPGASGWAVIVTGSHTIEVQSDFGFEAAAIKRTSWSITFSDDSTESVELGQAPRVIATELLANGRLKIDLDAALVHNVTYKLVNPTNLEFEMESVTLTGKSKAPHRIPGTAERALLDIDGRAVVPDNEKGHKIAGGDYALTGGLDTIEKAIWSMLLEQKGERYWDPEHGSIIDFQGVAKSPKVMREEERRLEARIESLPYVKAAVVTMTFESGLMYLSVRAQTDLGPLNAKKAVK